MLAVVEEQQEVLAFEISWEAVLILDNTLRRGIADRGRDGVGQIVCVEH